MDSQRRVGSHLGHSSIQNTRSISALLWIQDTPTRIGKAEGAV